MTCVILGVSGASGAALALSAARHLVDASIGIELVVSPAAERTLHAECGETALRALTDLADHVYAPSDIGARIASGSAHVAGMIVAPCSMRSLAAIANGLDDNLLTRSASVQLKERRPVVLLTREAPLTLAHLRNMTSATDMGAIILPPVPAFYLNPVSVADVVDQIAARAVDLLHVASPVARAWQG